MDRRDIRFASSLATAAGLLLAVPLAHIHLKGTPIALPVSLLAVGGLAAAGNAIVYVAHRLRSRAPFAPSFAKFFVTGVFNTLLDASIVNALAFVTETYDGGRLIAIAIASYCVTLCVSYWINRTWSFGVHAPPTLREFASFGGATASTFALTTGGLYYLTTVMGPPEGTSSALWINAAKFGMAGLSMVLNYSLLSLVIFKKKDPSAPRGSGASIPRTDDSAPTGSGNTSS